MLVAGPPGAGKSTVARRLAETWDRGVHLHTDDFYAWIVTGYVEPWRPESHDQNVMIAHAVAGTADRFAAAGYAVVVDGVLSPWAIGPYRALDRDVAYVVLRPSLQAAEQRAKDRGEHRLKELSVVGQMHAVFADLGDLEHHVIDSTDLTTDETVAEVRRRLDAGDLVLT